VTDAAAAEISSVRGDERSGNKAFQELYRELHSLAHRQLRGNMSPAALNTTALVHEAYLRVAHAGPCNIVDGEHFLAYAANAMRSVIVDIMRAHRAEKRGEKTVRGRECDSQPAPEPVRAIAVAQDEQPSNIPAR